MKIEMGKTYWKANNTTETFDTLKETLTLLCICWIDNPPLMLSLWLDVPNVSIKKIVSVKLVFGAVTTFWNKTTTNITNWIFAVTEKGKNNEHFAKMQLLCL